jgi:phage regulator Rha-like protein
MKENQTSVSVMDAQRMTSLEIAQVTGKMHKDVMKAIRNMEPAWEQERRRKFALMQIREEIPNGGYRLRPEFVLSKTECLYVATKFNDVARARLVLRWEQLEHERIANPGTHDSRIANSSEQRMPAMMNIGTRPTFEGKQQTLEVHILKDVGNLYGQEMMVEFVSRLRAEQRFDTREALIAQLEHDKQTTEEILLNDK